MRISRSLPAALAAVALVPSFAAAQSYGIDTPTAIGPYLNGVFPSDAPGAADTFTPQTVYDALSFDQPLVPRPEPNGSRMIVGQRDGLIWAYQDTASVSQRSVFLDLRDRCAEVWDGGLLGIAMHPEFGLAGSPHAGDVYVYYCYTATGNYPTGFTNGFFDVYLRLSKFTVPAGSQSADPGSEQVMIHMRLFNGSHRGGDIAFGPDGFLYVPIGDQFRYETAQHTAANLEGGVLRLDVDQDPARSHPPVRRLPVSHSEEFSGVGYWIPNDNPFPSPSGATFEEYWSVGHRNPHRMSFDSFTGDLYIGEVGGERREEINVVERGGNYGWPFREGLTTGPRSQPPSYVGTLVDPVLDFLRSQAFAIIGGYVYRGSLHANLYGKYICIDYGTDRIFAVYRDPQTDDWTQDTIGAFSPRKAITLGEDHMGELLIGRENGNTRLYGLAATNPSPDPPGLLSQIGAFSDLASLTPAPGLMPYDLNAPFWSDEAIKQRWVAIPNDGSHDTPAEQVGFDRRGGDWELPPGSVTVKHFELQVDDRDPNVRRRLETRFVVFTDDGYYSVSYHWLADGSDAVLATGRVEETIEIATEGEPRFQTWTFPGRQDCNLCHAPETGGALGLRTHQLNGDLAYPASGVTDNQLRTWNHLGLFAAGLDEADIPGLPAAVPVDDLTASVDDRARSYLDSNCSHCHRSDSATRAIFDARIDTPLYSSQFLYGAVSDSLGISGAHVITPRRWEKSIAHVRTVALGGRAMPPVAKNLVDEEAAELLRVWIRDMDPSPPQRVGNEVGPLPWTDGFICNMVINESDLLTNQGIVAIDARVEAFRFEAIANNGPITPFVVRVLGDDQFVVEAIGDTVLPGEYRVGTNAFPFSAREQRISLQPGQSLAMGFLDAFADGSKPSGASVVPFCFCNDADEIWVSGGPFRPDSASVTIGAPPSPGPITTTTHVREYAFAIDFAIETFNQPPSFGALPPVAMMEGSDTSFTVMATDPQGDDVIVYSADGLPTGMTIVPETGEIRGSVGLVSEGTYPVTVHASDGRATGSATFDLDVTPQPYASMYLSFSADVTLPGGAFARPEDVVLFDLQTGVWNVFLDGSSLGLTESIEGVHVLGNGEVLMSFAGALSIPGLVGGPNGDLVEAYDIVRYSPTRGRFHFHLDGSDLFFLDRPGNGINGISQLADGRLIVTTATRSTIAGLNVRNEDASAYVGSFGAGTRGRFTASFDGSAVGLVRPRESVNALCVAPGGELLISARDAADVPDVGEITGGDVVRLEGSFGGGSTSGIFRTFLTATVEGLGGAEVTAVHVD
ncbi:MAG: PQQ-dependent sugar dehydrogenase [Planctomycetota bacterium]